MVKHLNLEEGGSMDTSNYLRMIKAKGTGEKQKPRNMLEV